ncbi:MAG TPA: MBL fold metallo-hydrolase, partial [Ignavibacteriales bacterium]|nr:MBL fold metallo-hydrolase [Ignavibacteriales bacterium]
VETENSRFLIDCGMFQGTREEREKNRNDFFYNPAELDFMLLTHAHIDHSGLIPRLCNNGFRGKIYTTKATADLCTIMLPDSGHIQETEAEWRNRKRARVGEPFEEPLYTAAEAIASLQHFSAMNYDEIQMIAPGIEVRFVDAGHILGSASIELWVQENDKKTKIVFSGDIGQTNQTSLKHKNKKL